jgi:hypothetical protein
MYFFKVLLFILSIRFVLTHEIYTRTLLRGLHQSHMNKILGEEIQRIVERVIVYAQLNRTSYTHVYRSDNTGMDESGKILVNFSDEKILTCLQSKLIDAIITISEPKCCSSFCNKPSEYYHPICKFIVINW